MCLAEVLVAVGVAAVVSHVDGRHLGDVQGAVVSEVLQFSKEDSGGDTRAGGWGGWLSCEDERGLALVSAEHPGCLRSKEEQNSRGRPRESRSTVSDARRKRGP